MSLYTFNYKYIIKFEVDGLEQTYKVSELDLTSPEDIDKMFTDEFMQKVMERFMGMNKDLYDYIESIS